MRLAGVPKTVAELTGHEHAPRTDRGEEPLAVARREGIRNISEQHSIDTWVQHGAIEPGKW